MREEAAAERSDGGLDSAPQAIERARALIARLLDPALEPALGGPLGLDARLVADEPEQREVRIDLAVHHRFGHRAPRVRGANLRRTLAGALCASGGWSMRPGRWCRCRGQHARDDTTRSPSAASGGGASPLPGSRRRGEVQGSRRSQRSGPIRSARIGGCHHRAPCTGHDERTLRRDRGGAAPARTADRLVGRRLLLSTHRSVAAALDERVQSGCSSKRRRGPSQGREKLTTHHPVVSHLGTCE